MCSHIRYICEQIEQSIRLVRTLESAGVSAIGVHGRTRVERDGHPCRTEYIRRIAEATHLPIIAKFAALLPIHSTSFQIFILKYLNLHIYTRIVHMYSSFYKVLL